MIVTEIELHKKLRSQRQSTHIGLIILSVGISLPISKLECSKSYLGLGVVEIRLYYNTAI
jgi:hypothetical protein